MALKTKQTGVRLEESQAIRLDDLAKQFSNSPSGLVRLAVDRLIYEFDRTGELPGNPAVASRAMSDKLEAAAAAGARR